MMWSISEANYFRKINREADIECHSRTNALDAPFVLPNKTIVGKYINFYINIFSTY